MDASLAIGLIFTSSFFKGSFEMSGFVELVDVLSSIGVAIANATMHNRIIYE